MEFQEQLKKYRLQKQRQEKIDFIKQKFKAFLMAGTGKKAEDDSAIQIYETNEGNLSDINESDQDFTDEECEESSETEDKGQERSILNYVLYVVYFLFWVTLYVIAIELQFGIVFLIISALCGIYLNTRTSPKKRNEISAYSVFNKNCESIDGTLKAEQFEREMRLGALSMR